MEETTENHHLTLSHWQLSYMPQVGFELRTRRNMLLSMICPTVAKITIEVVYNTAHLYSDRDNPRLQTQWNSNPRLYAWEPGVPRHIPLFLIHPNMYVMLIFLQHQHRIRISHGPVLGQVKGHWRRSPSRWVWAPALRSSSVSAASSSSAANAVRDHTPLPSQSKSGSFSWDR